MTISAGDKLPDATLLRIGAHGPEQVGLAAYLADRRVVIFAVPGAFTPTCHTAHMPSFIRTKAALDAKGIDEVVCLSVNDPYVMQVWAEATGAASAGITMLADSEGTFTRAMGMSFDAPSIGLIARSQRYAMMVENGMVKIMNHETGGDDCPVSGGEAMLAAL